MTEKELKKLSRADLLEMLIDQSEEMQQIQNKLSEAEAELNKRQIAIDEAGTIADAALQLNGVFEAAQAACGQYMENIRTLSDRQEEVCRKREEESIQRSAQRLAETETRCAAMEAQTKEKCRNMIAKAKSESAACWEEVSQKLEAYCSRHAELRELLNSTRMNWKEQ